MSHNLAVTSLVFIDVDGTLVGDRHDPTDAVWQACQEAKDAGLTLVISTGRAGFGRVDYYARTLNEQGWHSFHNGAGMVNYGTGEIRTRTLRPEVLDWLAQVANSQPDWCLEFYTIDSYGISQQHRYLEAHSKVLGFEPAFGHHNSFGDIVRVQVVLPSRDVEDITHILNTTGYCDEIDASFATSLTMPDEAFVSITALGVNKGHALETIAGELGVALCDTMMVGDGNNDVEAITLAGVGVAMGNAHISAKNVADHIVGSVEEDGLIEALKLAIS